MVVATYVVYGRARGVFVRGIHVNRYCRVNYSSCIRAKLMASLRDYDLNIHIPSKLSAFKPPTNALCVHPRTFLTSFLNSHR
jgi:hypothetical protein